MGGLNMCRQFSINTPKTSASRRWTEAQWENRRRRRTMGQNQTTVRRRREDGLKTEADANAVWHAEAVVDPASIGGSWVFLRSNSISRSLLPGPRLDRFIIVTFLCAYFEKKKPFKW